MSGPLVVWSENRVIEGQVCDRMPGPHTAGLEGRGENWRAENGFFCAANIVVRATPTTHLETTHSDAAHGPQKGALIFVFRVRAPE